MILLDRHIMARFFGNFVLLFGLLFIFAISIDVVIQFDEFMEAAEMVSERDGRWYPFVFIEGVLEFHGPRIFQFYTFMVGLVGVAAAGFTIVQMHRSRELVAIMAAGIPLHRVVAVIMAGQVFLVLFQLADQELILPRLANRLARIHDRILQPGVETFEVSLARDAAGDLMYAESVDPNTGTATTLLVLRRGATGVAEERITSPSAVWNPEIQAWELENAEILGTAAANEGRMALREKIDRWETDLSPRKLLARRNANFAQMLSISQLRAMRDEGASTDGGIDRVIFGRFSGALVNLLVMAIVTPFFLIRTASTNMLLQCVKASLLAIPVLIGTLAATSVAITGIPPGVGAFLPVVLLLPIAFGRLAYLKT
jgi:lipopolysaccharide export LptBFGC system permease protein LptF